MVTGGLLRPGFRSDVRGGLAAALLSERANSFEMPR